MKEKYIILSSKPWNKGLADRLRQRLDGQWIHISNDDEFTYGRLVEMQPQKVFIPHWSELIPAKIFQNFECILFHMTDLPYGRGGSPLQNLIREGHEKTRISAIRVEKELDAGDVYLKRPLSLVGTAEEIFIRADKIIENMIVDIIQKKPDSVPQKGKIVKFTRRTPEESDIAGVNGLKELFNHIRMLDAKGYPRAFFETDHFRLEFDRASLKTDKIVADVRIFEK